MGHPFRITAALVACAFAGLATAGAQTFSDISAGLDPVHHGTSSWVDYDNDGDLDVFLNGQTNGSAGYITRLYRNDGGGTFTPVTGTGLPDRGGNAGVTRSAWGDFDGDGYADVALAGLPNGPGAPVTELYRNNSGNGTFTQVSAPALLGISWGTTEWGDYDNDGDLDLLVTGAGGGVLPGQSHVATVFRNDGPASIPPAAPAWSFTDIDPLSITPSFNYIAKVMGSAGDWGDYDRDGDLDLILTGYTGVGIFSRTRIYRNDGGVLVNANVTGLVDLADGDAAWGDYDGDGDLDLVLMGDQSAIGVPSTKHLRVYRNNYPNGTFTQAFAYFAGFTDGSAAWGDGNNDGHLDLLVTGSSTGWNLPETVLLYGNGSGGFTPDPLPGLDDLYEGQAAWGDYDNDGKLDILLSGRGTASNSVTTKIFKSNTPVANTAPVRPLWLPYQITASTIQVEWTAGGDAETDPATLAYNLSIRDLAGSTFDVPPMADAVTGFRRVVQLGNTNHRTEWTIGGLQPGTSYRVCVQTIDQGFMASDFRCQTIITSDPGEEPEMTIRDCLTDNGSEPSIPNCGTIHWESPDIWVRHAQDGQSSHQPPVFGYDNYVYVRLTNGGTSTLPGGTVHVYYSKPGTAQPWPLSWVADYNSSGVLQGDFIGQAEVGSIAPGATDFAWVKWEAADVPNPDDFPGISWKKSGHFCLLARFTSPADPMTYPELQLINDNVLYNNNIASKNVIIMTPIDPNGWVSVGRPQTPNSAAGFTITSGPVAEGGEDHALNHVSLRVTLPPALYERWVNGGRRGSGISTRGAGENSFFVTSRRAALEGLHFEANEEFALEVQAIYPEKTGKDSRVTPEGPSASGPFPVRIVQMEGERVIGGQTLLIHLSDEEEGRSRR